MADTNEATEMAADADAPGNAEVQKVADTATEQGFMGTEVDQTPNENYTVQGVLAGKPTPETTTDESRA